MLTRVADSLYWMNRYLERAEFSARLVSLQVQRLPMGSADEIARGWQLLLAGLGADPSGVPSCPAAWRMTITSSRTAIPSPIS